MNTVQIISDLLREKGITASKMCKDLGFSSGLFTQWKQGKQQPSARKIEAIADYFHVTVDFLLGNSSIAVCEECGLEYDSNNAKDLREHTRRHTAWERAIDKFGFCWAYQLREQKKAEARNKIASGNLTSEEYIDAQLIIFKALFSRSLQASEFSLTHVDFPTYVAMMLNQKQWKQSIYPPVYKFLVSKYGTKPGISSGTYYTVPEQSTEKSPLNNEQPVLQGTYFRLAKGAQELGLNDDDVDAILNLYRKHKERNE